MDLAGDVGDEVERAAFRLDVEAAEILADEAEDEHLDRGQNDDDQHRRGPALHPLAAEIAPGDVEQKEQRAGREDDREVTRPAQRRGGETRDGVEREAHHLAERIVGLAGVPLGAVVGEGDLAEADPGDHAADEARLFGERQQRVERAPRHQAEVAGVERNRRVGDAVEEAVEDRRRRLLEQGLALALAAHGVDHVGLLARHQRAHLAEQFGRVLQVGVDDEDLLARAEVEPGGERELVPVVARQIDRDDVRVRCRQRLHRRPARVARAVVDEHDLVVLPHRRARRRRDAGVKQREGRFLVVARDDDGERGAVHDPRALTPRRRP